MNINSARVKAIRTKLGMTRVQFAIFCNVTRQTITNWETDKSPPTGAAVRLLLILEERDSNEHRDNRQGTGEV